MFVQERVTNVAIGAELPDVLDLNPAIVSFCKEHLFTDNCI